MRKKIVLIILAVCMALNMATVYAEEKDGEIPEIHNSITLYSEHEDVYVGEKIRVTAAVSSVDSGADVQAVWKVNGEELEEFPGEAITLQENMQLEFNYVVPAVDEAGEMVVSLCIYGQEGMLIASAEKRLAVKTEIPVSIQSTTKTQKAYFDQKVIASVQLVNDTGRDFDFKAHWEQDGKKMKGYESEHFAMGETAASSCPITLAGLAGKKVKATFVLDNGITSTSLDIVIDVLNYPPEVIYRQKVAEMRKTIKTIEIECTFIKDSNVYKEPRMKTKTAYKAKGTKGIYFDYYGTTAAEVRFPDGTTGWVPFKNISISNTNYADSKDCSSEMKEIFVNENGYKSETKYLIWISLKFQKVNAFTGEKGKWKLVRSAPCATGKNSTPTISGVFKYSQYQERWNFGKYYVRPIMRFNGGAALHSRTYRPDGSLYDPTLGKPVSHGCVRMIQEDIDWLAKNIPLKTTVVVF